MCTHHILEEKNTCSLMAFQDIRQLSCVWISLRLLRLMMRLYARLVFSAFMQNARQTFRIPVRRAPRRCSADESAGVDMTRKHFCRRKICSKCRDRQRSSATRTRTRSWSINRVAHTHTLLMSIDIVTQKYKGREIYARIKWPSSHHYHSSFKRAPLVKRTNKFHLVWR